MRQLKITAKLPSRSELDLVFFSFSRKEWIGFWALTALLLFSTVALLQTINQSFMVQVPMHGGSFTEGIVGTPRFVNPVLAFSDADKDMIQLVYSGLMRKNPDGTLIPDLAQSYEMSPDGLSYTFILKDKIFFHDGKPVTPEDIIFTIEKVKDPIIKSPKKPNWDGITATKSDDKTIVFTLRQPHSSFLENATLGILPSHIWGDSPIELNTANISPIGSGPYQVKDSKKESSGTITYYRLQSFNKFALGRPYIKTIELNFYDNEQDLVEALSDKSIQKAGYISPQNAEELKESNQIIYSSTLPRVFGLFFNQNQNQLFTNRAVTSAINQAIDKDRIVNEVLLGYGVAIDSPIPQNITGYEKLALANTQSREDSLAQARETLEGDGWKIGESGFLEKTVKEGSRNVTKVLEFSISTSNAAELAKSASLIQEDLAAIGIKVEVKTFDIGNLNQSVIRPRNYDSLLFGQIINSESDLYAFWHSSQRRDPGLNVALYTNTRVDTILEDAFVTINKDERIKKYSQFEDEVIRDIPAVFLYSPNFIYAVGDDIKALSIDHIVSPSARFSNVYLWYIKTDNIWKVFSK